MTPYLQSRPRLVVLCGEEDVKVAQMELLRTVALPTIGFCGPNAPQGHIQRVFPTKLCLDWRLEEVIVRRHGLATCPRLRGSSGINTSARMAYRPPSC